MPWEPITEHDAPLPLPRPGNGASVRLSASDEFVNKAVERWRRLADEFDTRAFRFLVSGQTHESLAASIEAVRCGQHAVEIYRLLADTWPSSHLSDLAGALDLLAGYLRKVGSREYEAQDAAREACEIRRRLQGLSP
jgi:hypothetical protein